MAMRSFYEIFKLCTENTLIMPRTRRPQAADQPGTDAAETPQAETPQAAPETAMSGGDANAAPPSQTPSDQDAPKPTRRRRASTTIEETPAPVAEVAPAQRRGGRRAKTAEPVSESIEASTVPETATETPPPRRRGRAGKVDVTAAPENALPETPAPRRRGRTRAAAVEAEAMPETPAIAEAPAAPIPPPEPTLAQFAEGVPQEEALPARRRGRRRGAEPSPIVTLAPAELPDVEAPVVVEAQAEESSSEETAPAGEKAGEGSKKGRRARRGRRRRDLADEGFSDALLLEAEEAAETGLILPEAVAVDEEPDEDEAAFVFPPPTAPAYVAPLLVPPAMPPADESAGPRVRASIHHAAAGLPHLVINDKTHLPYFFFVNAEAAVNGDVVDSQIRGAAGAGIHLYSGVLYLPFRNAYGDRSFGPIDAFVQQVLDADPDAYLLPRLQFVPTNYWLRTHADQTARFADGSEGDVSLASTEFWADCVDALEALVDHFADPATPGGDRVVGFHLDRGEWFNDPASGYDLSAPNQTAFQNWLHAKYQHLYALRAAWHDGKVTWEDAAVPIWPGPAPAAKKADPSPLYATAREGRWPDYALFSSDLAAQIITGLAEAVKTLSMGRLLVGVSYGYTLEFAGRNDSGHLAMATVLDSPHIDIVAGPQSYAGRGAGSAAGFSTAVDSVVLHGKLWVTEDDTKTFLAEAETDDTYNPKIVGGADTQAIHQRHFGAALAHRGGVSWMDLWGQGWLDSPDIWAEIGGLREQAAHWSQMAGSASAPDVAVLVDEASLAFVKSGSALGTHLVLRTRDLLLRAGASVGFYLQSDVTRSDFPDAKLYLFLNPLRLTTNERQAIRERLQRPGKTLAWVYAPGAFDEHGPAREEAGDVVGLSLRLQPWNSRVGSQITEARHPITDRLRSGKRIGQEEVLNPSYAVSDPQATVLAEYIETGEPSLAVREHSGGWKSVFFGDPHLTVEMLRGLYAYAGVPLYDAQDDVVYASSSGVLLVHTPYTGQRTLSLPEAATVYDALEHKIIATEARSFRTFLRARTTRLFLWGEAEAITSATGLSLPARDSSAEADPPPSSRESRPLPPTSGRPQAPLLAVMGDPPDEQDIVEELTESLSRLEIVEDTLSAGEELPGETDGSELSTPAPRSRWQRRRAAARARRDAERQAADEAGAAAGPPLDIADIMPGLPARRLPTAAADEPQAPSVEESDLPL